MILEPIAAPIEERDGALRVKGSRIPVDTLVYRFHDGATPEDIAEDFPSSASTP